MADTGNGRTAPLAWASLQILGALGGLILLIALAARVYEQVGTLSKRMDEVVVELKDNRAVQQRMLLDIDRLQMEVEGKRPRAR